MGISCILLLTFSEPYKTCESKTSETRISCRVPLLSFFFACFNHFPGRQCSEGVSFLSVRRTFLADVPVAPSGFIQQTGRAIRMLPSRKIAGGGVKLRSTPGYMKVSKGQSQPAIVANAFSTGRPCSPVPVKFLPV